MAPFGASQALFSATGAVPAAHVHARADASDEETGLLPLAHSDRSGAGPLILRSARLRSCQEPREAPLRGTALVSILGLLRTDVVGLLQEEV